VCIRCFGNFQLRKAPKPRHMTRCAHCGRLLQCSSLNMVTPPFPSSRKLALLIVATGERPAGIICAHRGGGQGGREGLDVAD
jgi:hypothetical protein